MPNKALTMLQIRRILKLMMEESSQREIHRNTGIHRVTLKTYLHRFKSSGKTFSELFALCDHDLSVLVHPPRSNKTTDERYADLSTQLKRLSEELGKKNSHVTKQVLWEEYLQDHPAGYQYSQFCYHLDHYMQHHDVTMPQQHQPGYACRSTLPATHSGSSTRSPEHVLTVPFWSAPCPAAAFFIWSRSHPPDRNI